jgi:hypothetical protein
VSAFRFPLIPGRPLAESLSGIPSSFASFLRQGFSVLSSLPPKHYGVLIDQVVDAIDSPSLQAEEKFASEIGLKESDLNPLVAAVTMVCVTLSSTEETPESVINAALAAKILPDSQKETVLNFAKAVAQMRGRLKEVMQQSRIATRVLPALAEFETVVDVRPSFKKDEIAFSVPVVMVHIDTDASNQEIWFQMSKSQLKFLIDNLQETLRRVERVEAWSGAMLPSVQK